MFSASDYGLFVKYFIMYGIGFILGSYGGLFSECSGIINIALEGSMVFGAFSGLIFLQVMNTWLAGTWLVTTMSGLLIVYLLASIVAVIAGFIFSYLLSFVSIKLGANQTVVGTALNTVAVAVCTIINTQISGKDSPEVSNNIFSSILLLDTGNAFIDRAFSGLNISVIIGLIAIVALWLIFNKTKFGLRLRACGENPAAADSVGINVYRLRYSGTAIGSCAAALAGFIIFSCLPIGTWQINALGYGFLVIAIEIFGNWKATNIIFCSLFFAFFMAFAPTFTAALSSSGIEWIDGTIFEQRPLYYLLPYFIALLTLVIFSKRSRAPKAEGIPYDKSSR